MDGEDKFLCTFAGVLEDLNDPFSTSLGMQFSPQVREPWEIFVNAEGKRFVREDHPSVHVREHSLLSQPQYWLLYRPIVLNRYRYLN